MSKLATVSQEVWTGDASRLAANLLARAGLPFDAAEAASIDGLRRTQAQLAAAPFAGVADWWEAGAIVRAMDQDSLWWNTEEEERERLWQVAADRLGEEVLLAAVSEVHDPLAPAVRAAAQAAAARAGVADPELAREAALAALLAVHQATLARLGGEADDHFFFGKLALFVAGRWPLGLHRGVYRVF